MGVKKILLPVKNCNASNDDAEAAVTDEGEPRNRTRMWLDENRRRKQAHLKQSDYYRLIKHIFINNKYYGAIVCQTVHRKIMAPRHLELLIIFLRTAQSVVVERTLKLWCCCGELSLMLDSRFQFIAI